MWNSASATYTLTVNSPYNSHDYVDLRLPSGTKWAKCNVGASSESAYGNYYMYGKGTRLFNYSDSAYTGNENPLSSSVDTARQVMGGLWHMPTKTQCQELLNNTVHTTATISNINGIMFYKSNDTNNYVFIPLAGYKTYTTLAVGTNASIWTSTPGEETGSAMIFRMNDTDNPYFLDLMRSIGGSIRGVVG